MKKKSIVFLTIFIVWVVVCAILYKLKLLDLIGILISFAFAIPTMLYDYIVSMKTVKRNKKLKAIKTLTDVEKTFNAIHNDLGMVANRRIRAGYIRNYDEATYKQDVEKALLTNETLPIIKNAFSILCKKAEIENNIKLICDDNDKFVRFYIDELKKLKTIQEELNIFEINLSDMQKYEITKGFNKE